MRPIEAKLHAFLDEEEKAKASSPFGQLTAVAPSSSTTTGKN